MKEWIKNLILAFCIALIVLTTMVVLDEEPLEREHHIKWAKSYEETASRNMVTAIYLDYRLFDTFIEAVILFVAVGGIIFMSKKDEDVT